MIEKLITYYILYLGFICKRDFNYIFIISFFTLRLIFNYNKCTYGYFECKLRKIPQKKGFINTRMNNFVNIRNDKDYYIILFISLYFIFDYIKSFF